MNFVVTATRHTNMEADRDKTIKIKSQGAVSSIRRCTPHRVEDVFKAFYT
jgi:hypothetical protein